MNNSISMRSIVVATRGQVSSNLGDEVAILDLEGGTYYGLDNVGARVWELIQEPRTVGEVHATILNEYDVDPQRCQTDIITLVQSLRGEGLVDILDEGSA